MILDLPRFLATERAYWDELEAVLNKIGNDPLRRLPLAEITRLQYLYQRSASALARLSTFSAEPETREYLELLVARAYAECHPKRTRSERLRPRHWLLHTFPQTFRRHTQAFGFAVGLTIAGAIFGWTALTFDYSAKSVLMPFPRLMQPPAQRVKQDEKARGARLAGHKSTFAAELMTHNIEIALLTFAMGATWGVGSVVLLFYNGVTLGAVAADYVHAGFTQFLLGWLLPHGVIEIPAILIAGQAGFVLAAALIGGRRRERLRERSSDLLTLAAGAPLLLVWAGIVEAFFSQYDYPVLPYDLKIAFGLVELVALAFYLYRAGRT
ncbi:MAG: stage II sporulation protein M [Bryobacteraceae bacterium]